MPKPWPLAKAGPAALGATLYVTLEPCCHWGRTPPCADAIIKAGIVRVVCALQDPDPRVNGGGIARLWAAGVDVSMGKGAADAARVMSGFLNRILTGRPEVIPCGPAFGMLPDGADARLTLSEAGADVKLRSGKVLHLTGDGEALLDQLGALGLTTVALHPAPGCASGRTASAAPVLASGGANRSGRAFRSATVIP
ncbi:MAG: bifunctional diaminohydroxyphosphoribosylaminopyrimidine deaminase/5-amino-6-(5-phosphoribosylamino)uracil reductase RibD [Alkalilacustris sp.]